MFFALRNFAKKNRITHKNYIIIAYKTNKKEEKENLKNYKYKS